MKISAFTFLRNVAQYGYPFEASIRSVLPIVDEFVALLASNGSGKTTLARMLVGINDLLGVRWLQKRMRKLTDAKEL